MAKQGRANKTTASGAKKESVKKTVTWQVVLLTVVACFSLLIANSALWANNVFFNTQNFTQLTTEAVLSSSSRNAISQEVVDTALANRPAAKRVVEGPATKLIAGLLDTNLATTAFSKVVAALQTALTTPRPQPVTIDLSGVKDTLNKLIDVTGREQAAAKLNQVPDQVTLLDTNKLPNVYAAGQALLFMGPITLIVGVVLLAYPHIRRRNYAQSSTILLLQGSLLLLTGLLAYAIGPIFRPTVLAQVSSANLRVVVENIYNTFISSFNAQSAWLLYVGGLLVLIPCGVWLYHTSVAQELKGKLKRG